MKLNPGANNIRTTYDPDKNQTTFLYDTPKKKGNVAICLGLCEHKDGEIVKIQSETGQISNITP